MLRLPLKDLDRYVHTTKFMKPILAFLVIVGVVFAALGINGPDRFNYHILTALGVSLVVGTVFGSWSGSKLGWPMGLWLGLVLALIFAPLISGRLKGSFSSYFASFLGPMVGAIIGGWTELKDKKEQIKERSSGVGLRTLKKK